MTTTKQQITQRVGIIQRVAIDLSVLSLSTMGILAWYVAALSTPTSFVLTSADFSVAVANGSDNSATLTWTAPGDDGSTGQAASYDVRYSTSPITAGTWDGATTVDNEPVPGTAGTNETMVVSGLAMNTTYYFALKTTDEASNQSAISNVATKTTTCTEAWSCGSWSTCTSGTQSRTCSDLNNCGTTVNRPATSQSCSSEPPPPACQEDWSCGDWTACSNSQQTRTCTDRNDCGSQDDRPGTSRSCTEPPDDNGQGGGEDITFQETFIVAALNRGGAPLVRVLSQTGSVKKEFLAYEPTFTGGVNLAVCDLGGDGIDEIVVAPGAGRQPMVRIYSWDGRLINEFLAYAPTFTGGVNVACGNVDNRGSAEIVTAPASGGGPNIRIFSYVRGQYVSTIKNFFAFGPRVRGGYNLAVTNFDGSRTLEIVAVPGPLTGGPQVRPFEYVGTQFENRILGFMAYAASFRGGVSFCSGDTNNDRSTELFTTPEPGGGPHVRKFGRRRDGSIGLQDPGFFVFAESFRGGVSCALGDFDYNNKDELVVAVRSRDQALVRILTPDGKIIRREFTAFPASITVGVKIATGQFFAPQ